jgi:membrane associated rhomboid family serine protease
VDGVVFILPVNDDGYIGRRAYVFLGLVVVNAIVLVATYIHPSYAETVFRQYGFVPADPHVSALLTSMFVHAGFWHFARNMFFLWMFGCRVENTFGRLLFAAIYIFSGCGAAALHFAFNKASTIPLVGASGAISGIVGCYLVLFPRSQFDVVVVLFRWPIKTIHTETLGAVGAWIGEQAILALLTQAAQFSEVAFWGHIGGFVTGAALTSMLLLIAPQLRRRGDPPPVVRFVRGKVRDTTGKPITDAEFQLHDDFHPATAAMTDTKGRFSFAAVPDGTYSFRLTKTQFQTVEGTVVVRRKRRFPSSFNFTMSSLHASKRASVFDDPVGQATGL